MTRPKTAIPKTVELPARVSPVPLTGLPPLIAPNTRLLVLGSFPGAASLAAGRYYAHPQNHFWKILRDILPPADAGIWGAESGSYEARVRWMLAQGVGVWDVYAGCEREGSLDSSIRNAIVNDFAFVRRQCPRLQAIAHNGGESFRHARHTSALGLPVFKLPSTSPANASWSFARKRDAWREVFVAAGLVEPSA